MNTSDLLKINYASTQARLAANGSREQEIDIISQVVKYANKEQVALSDTARTILEYMFYDPSEDVIEELINLYNL